MPKGKNGQPLKPKPVNNARADKLDRFMWRYSFAERRCLIPITKFAEAEGEKGGMTRTGFALPDQPVFAVAGIWRETEEWGAAYSMVMTEACIHVVDARVCTPVILKREDWSDWLDGPPDAAERCAGPIRTGWWSTVLLTRGGQLGFRLQWQKIGLTRQTREVLLCPPLRRLPSWVT